MLNLSVFSHNNHPSGVNLLAKYIRRGIRVLVYTCIKFVELFGFPEGNDMPAKMKHFASIVISLVCLLALPLIVQADHRTINTADGLVDPAWVHTTSVIDGSDYADPNWDIQQAWVTNEADNSVFYFRVKLYGKMPANDWSGVEALLDCNHNGVMTDASDVVVYFAPGSAYPNGTGACQGNLWPTTCNDYHYTPNSEIIGNTPTDYEWKAATNEVINYSACTGTINVGFRTTSFDSNGTNPQFRDTTNWINYSAPTRVTLSSFTAQNAAGPLALLGGTGVLALLVFGLRRSQK
jgi:hypothetical protein